MKRKRDSSPGLASGDDGEPPGAEFEVFLNFRGPDTRLSFTDCLYHAMEGAGVRVFRDEEEIHKGEEIGGELLHAIDSSKVYVTVFSRDYASSAWCLRELAHIVESSRGSSGKVILPIFYGVDASDVKLRTGLYDEALKKHEDRFGCDEVRRWKEALIKVAGIKGWDSKGKGEGAIIKHIVDEVLTRLKKRQRNLPDHLVGIHNHLEDMMCLLQEGSLDVRFVVIHGMGGIGKTTLAEAVFNRISHQFSARSFLSNVRESSQDDKLRELQWRLLSDILKFRPERIYDTNDGINMIKERFRHKKVLIVLDDVDKGNQLMKLAGKHDWFGPGSRIIITTRDISFLSINKGRQRDSDSIHHEEFYIYEMKEMPLNHALELFSNHAFRRDTPPHGYYNNIATKIVKTTGGLPLALKVIGSSLCYKSEAVWQDMLEKLMKMPHKEVHDILMISYEMLEYEQKQIFLDIACHMAGEKIDDAIFMWKSCEFFPNHAIDVLINMSLIKVVDNEKLWMHDQLKDLGREIVHRESIQFPGRRSRLWCPRLAMEVIRRKKGTEEIVALKLDGHSKSHNFTPEEFSKLENLRFLELDGGNFVGDFESLLSELRWLSWHNCPSEFQATNFCLSNLVILKISGSDIKNDWEGWSQIMGTSNLKVLSLLSCKSLIKMPDFSMCSTLERLVLKDCESLVEIDPSIGNQEHLQYLEISGCNRLGSFLEEASSEISPCVVPQFLPDSMGSLQFLTTLKMEDLALLKLPNSIGELACLQCLSLSECPNLSKLPNSVGKLRSLVELDLSYTGLTELPDSIGELRRMKVINMTMSKIRKIPKAIGMVEQLEELHAFSCDLEGEIPSEIGALSSLKILNLGFTHVGGVPTTIDQLSQLEVLRLDACHELRQLPKLPASLTCLEFMSSSLENIPDLSNLTNLVDLILSDVRPENSFGYGYCETFDVCTEYSSQAPNLSWIGRLSKLQSLTLDLTNITVVPPELNSLSGLQELELPCSDLKSLAQLPPDLQFLTLKGFGSTLELSHPHNFNNLSRLILSRSWLTEILLDGLGQLENLRELRVSWCKALEKISGLSRLTQLRDFKVISCPRLVEIQGLDQSKSLEHIYLHRCDSTTELPDLLNLPKLGTLEISQCGLGSLPAVANNEICYLKIYKCRMLRNFRGTYQCYFNQSQDDPSSHLSTRQ